ncbi:hypothetical protein B0T26DRAFT_727329 [Lasiosphaeria miniovina]|uniref:CHAT domain-containing protein n=1 Tax=Lasiosphaeria miniovina TaxID=1954250 RepID=A0AA39ZZN5_9PEZI|nr:uncharacterized protein B0T26DRAFT_727329 [Lasiosphaeria miniovina]KAK0706616.1 hypothetical protein B0T26DRAFT_727329 [Lasiosphaeria miniovina]
MLEWLWDAAVRPILGELGFLEPPSDDSWPRVWWIPTGPLSLLPLHAAGRPFPHSTESALDRVVSSYSSSVKALLYSRQNSQNKDLDFVSGEALLVSMHTTPTYSDLVFAEEEVKKMADILPDSIRKVTLNRPSRDDVMAGLNTCTIFHFAGHGESHPPQHPKTPAVCLRNTRIEPKVRFHPGGRDLLRPTANSCQLRTTQPGIPGSRRLSHLILHSISVAASQIYAHACSC